MKKNMFIKAHIPFILLSQFYFLLYFILQTVKYTSLGTMSQDCDLGKETKKKGNVRKKKKMKDLETDQRQKQQRYLRFYYWWYYYRKKWKVHKEGDLEDASILRY